MVFSVVTVTIQTFRIIQIFCARLFKYSNRDIWLFILSLNSMSGFGNLQGERGRRKMESERAKGNKK